MTKLKFLLISFVILIWSYVPTSAQNEYTIPSCNISKSQKFVGDRLRLPLPKGAIVKKGRDIDYEDYYVGFGEKKTEFGFPAFLVRRLQAAKFQRIGFHLQTT